MFCGKPSLMESDTDYPYAGVPLSPKAALDVVTHLLADVAVTRSDLIDQVTRVHAAGGGTFISNEHLGFTVKKALAQAKTNRVATSPRNGWYRAGDAHRDPRPGWAVVPDNRDPRFDFNATVFYPLHAPPEFIAAMQRKAETIARASAEGSEIVIVDVAFTHTRVVWSEYPRPAEKEWTRPARQDEEPIGMQCSASVHGLYKGALRNRAREQRGGREEAA